MPNNIAIICFSHLRWDFVYQRPQHVLSRLARTHRVFFIEEPLQGQPDQPEWEISEAVPNILVCRPRTPSTVAGFHGEQLLYLEPMVLELVKRYGIDDFILWFYTPLALPAARTLQPRAVVFDCMDELSAFQGADSNLRERERELLEWADIVFTGGPSLYRARKDRHPRVYCFPSSVDAAHFGQAMHAPEPAEQAGLSHPRLGFFGVLDERLDLSLLQRLATSHPEWNIVMVGPVVKIDPATLPQAGNIQYLGRRQYSELPGYLGGWDVCLLPFARNRSTEFISPTKTLEYMAAEKMIVSTPIRDVAEPYGEIVFVGATSDEFISACEAALQVGSDERLRRRHLMREVLRQTSWESTVAQMESLMASLPTTKVNGTAPRTKAHTVVVGAGPTGLSAAYHAGKDCLLIEQNSRVGGWCRSTEVDGFTFDFAGHIMFSG